MYPYRRKPSGPPIVRILIAGIVLFMIFRTLHLQQRGGSSSPSPSQWSSPTPSAQPASGEQDRILRALTPPTTAPARDGIAAAILIDTSGSMADPVRDADGSSRPKIQIAQRCVLDLIRTAEQFAREHPDRPVLLGIYEFSGGRGTPCRQVVPLAGPSLAAAQDRVQAMRAQGATPIGDAVITAKRDLETTGLLRQHILVVTDGQNTAGSSPVAVLAAMNGAPGLTPAATYFIAFDTAEAQFSALRQNGATLLSAADAKELQETVNSLLTGRILVE